jgi:hypothetical protein
MRRTFAGVHTDVVFLKVMEGESDDAIMAKGIRGFPTFQFYIKGKLVQQLVGADPVTLGSNLTEFKRRAQYA